jgi:hypothetical protein
MRVGYGASNHLAEIDDPLGLYKSPSFVRGLRHLIVEQSIGANFVEPARPHEGLDMTNELRGNAVAPDMRFDPNPFQERDRRGDATIRIFANCQFSKAGRPAIARLRNKSPGIVSGQYLLHHRCVIIIRFLRPKGAAHRMPRLEIGLDHLTNGEKWFAHADRFAFLEMALRRRLGKNDLRVAIGARLDRLIAFRQVNERIRRFFNDDKRIGDEPLALV